MTSKLSHSAQKVQDALNALGMDLDVVELPDSTRTVVEAAGAVNCDVGQIVKSLVFKGARSERPLLIIASGGNRVSEKKVEALIGEPLGKANADFVRQHTGFAIGGVPPLGHIKPIMTFVDEDLLNYEEVWAAAGTPNAVFRLNPTNLERMTGGQVVDIKRGT